MSEPQVSAATQVDGSTVAALTNVVGVENVSLAQSELSRHGRDESYHDFRAPDLVVYPRSTAEVAGVVQACASRRLTMTPFGAGTSLEGHVAPLRGGVCIDLTKMNRILDIHVGDLDVAVEVGVTRRALERVLGPVGVFFPVDPGADATVGGMISTGASGTTSVRYGTMRENVLALTVVLPDGEVLTTRSRARKSSAGYDLTHLFIGAEGTLGVVTEAVLRLHPIPDAIGCAVASFKALADAVQCAIAAIQSGIPIARAELLDSLQMEAVATRFGLPYPIAPTLFLEFHGSPAAVESDTREVEAIALDFGAMHLQKATRTEERQRLWEARHRAYDAVLSLREGARRFPTDVCVPLSRLAECLEKTQEDLAESGLLGPIVGHVGDGNFHVILLIDTGDTQEVQRVKEFNERLVRRAIDMGGTCTGEHGIGLGKANFLELEHDDAALTLMRGIKELVDPIDLMNPGKILPARFAPRTGSD